MLVWFREASEARKVCNRARLTRKVRVAPGRKAEPPDGVAHGFLPRVFAPQLLGFFLDQIGGEESNEAESKASNGLDLAQLVKTQGGDDRAGGEGLAAILTDPEALRRRAATLGWGEWLAAQVHQVHVLSHLAGALRRSLSLVARAR
jgi:hypothetical protein